MSRKFPAAVLNKHDVPTTYYLCGCCESTEIYDLINGQSDTQRGINFLVL